MKRSVVIVGPAPVTAGRTFAFCGDPGYDGRVPPATGVLTATELRQQGIHHSRSVTAQRAGGDGSDLISSGPGRIDMQSLSEGVQRPTRDG